LGTILNTDRALSPVIAAIILIAVTVTVSVSAALWMGNITFTFMRDEEMIVTGHQWAWDCSYIDLTVRNTGTSSTKIAEIRINDVTVTNIIYLSGNSSLSGGSSATIRLFSLFRYGTKYEFLIITQTGNRFYYQLNAPATSSTNIPPGTEILRPNLPGTYQQWETFGGALEYALTSDSSDATGVQIIGSTTLIETVNLADTHVGAGVINSVTAYARTKATSTETESTRALLVGRDSATTLNTPKTLSWNNPVWSSQGELPSADSPVRQVRSACSPRTDRSEEKIAVTLSDDGYLDAYVFNGTSWSVTNNIGRVWTSAPSDARRPFDVAYESQSGEALLVYGTTVAGGTNDLAYRTWTRESGWSSEQYYDDAGHSSKITVTFVVLASDLNSDKIGMAYIENTNNDANTVVWTGSSWGNFMEITGTVAISTEECIAISSESVSGAFMAVAGEGQFIKWSRFTTLWSNVGIFDINSGATSAMNWLKLSSSQDNRLMLTSVDAASDLCTALWDGNSLGNRQWSTASQSIGSMTATTSVTAMRFTAQASKSVTNILVYIQTATASPAYRFGIETSGADYLPSGTYAGGASNYAVYTPTAAGWLNLTLPSAAPLTAGTVYHITVRYDSGTIGASNYIALRRMGTVPNMFRPKENAIDPWLNTISGTTIQNRDPLFVLKYSDNTFESMPYDTATVRNIFGVNWFSEKWTQNAAQTITGINIPLVKAGTPLGSLFITLRDETNSQDVATITIPQSEITTTLQWYEKYFASPITLQSGRVYRLVLKSPSSTTSGNSFRCYSLSTSQSGDLTYDGTTSIYSSSANSGSTWTNTDTIDLTYILLSGAGTSGWVVHTPWDTGVDTNAQRCADFAWEPSGGRGLLVYGTSGGQITWRRFNAPNYMTAATNVAMGANVHPWVQLKSNTRTLSGDVRILGAVLEGTVFDLGAVSWDGSTFVVIGTATFSADTAGITYESFDLEFENFAPTEKAIILWRTHDTNYQSIAFTISRTDFTDYSETRTINPNTSLPWTWDEINALEIGCIASTLGTDETIHASEFWIIVDYNGTGS
jgi:flagellin-like protein